MPDHAANTKLWITNRPADLPEPERGHLQELLAGCSHLTVLAEHVRVFAELLTHRRGTGLEGWMTAVEDHRSSRVARLRPGPAQGHLATVGAGLSLPYSNGPTEAADTADGPGYDRILAWADAHAPHERVWALEGTGSFAAGFAQTLADAGEAVVEVGAAKRTRGAKNDHVDAVRAARSALAREFQTLPRARGLRVALRMVLATRSAVLVSRTKA